MAGLFDRFRSALSTAREPAKPFKEQGVAGFAAFGGYVSAPEKNPDVAGPNRWHTASDILINISVIAASVRYSLNLVSRPSWRAEPPSDKQEAKDAAEFVEEVLNGIDTSWSRIVRRSAIYRFHGFNLQEWVAKKRDDGRIGIESVEPRPVHTITKWDLDENGGVLGVIQVSPQTGQEIYLPRPKLVYLVDDALTDRPEGMGWFRHLADPAQRLRRYLKLETMGFERDLAGIPVARVPLQRINQLVAEGKLTKQQAEEMIEAAKDFVKIKVKEPSTGIVFDSEPFRGKSADGETISTVMQWGLDLLTGSPTSSAQLGEALHRLMYDMAMIIGTEQMLVGNKGEGSRALSEDKSRNLYLTSNAALADMAEAYDRDIVTTLWTMNGLPDELRPKLKTEDVAFKDVEVIARALAEMSTAGAILHPNDPAINELRDLMGVAHAPEVPDDIAALMLNTHAGVPPPQPTGGGPDNKGRPSRENPGGPGGKPAKGPSGGGGRAQKYDPDQPRAPAGSPDGGEWIGEAVAIYVGDDPYSNAIGINGKIRAGDQLSGSEQQTLAGVNAAFANAAPLEEPMTVYRGTGEPVYGAETTVAHPLSTSRQIEVADEFSTGTGGSKPSVYRIDVPAGARVLDTSPHMPEGMRYQQEVLLEPGGKLVPYGTPGQSDGVVYRRLRYIPPKREG